MRSWPRPFIASAIKIPADIPQHASYIESWFKPLKSNKREIFRAADAQKIVDIELSYDSAYPLPKNLPGKLLRHPGKKVSN